MFEWLWSLTAQQLGIIVSGLLGLYGAVLSTINFVASRREKQRNLKVELDTEGVIVDTATGQKTPPQVKVSSLNRAHQKVTIATMYFEYKQRGKWRYFTIAPNYMTHRGSTFPLEVDPGKSFDYVIPLRIFKEGLLSLKHLELSTLTVRAVVVDQVKNEFKSNKVKVLVAAIKKMETTKYNPLTGLQEPDNLLDNELPEDERTKPKSEQKPSEAGPSDNRKRKD